MTIISGFIHLMIALYVPSMKWKRIATPVENEINSLMMLLTECLAIVGQSRMPLVLFQFIKRLTALDLSKAKNGISQFVFLSTLFSYAGISFALHRKILSLLKEKVNQQDVFEKMSYAFSQITNDRMEGNYRSHFYDSAFVEESLRIGNIQKTSYYVIFSFFIEVGQGRFNEAMQKIEKLQEMVKLFDNYIVENWVFIAKAKLWTKQGRFMEALVQAEKFIEFSKKEEDKDPLIWGYATKAYIQFRLEDVTGAEHSLQQARQYAKGDVLFVYNTTLILSQFAVNLYHLERSIRNDKGTDRSDLNKKACETCKEAVNMSLKIADDRVELLKLTGTYYWLIGNQKKAIKWWGKSIIAGEKLGAIPELARAYLEIGIRLKEPESRYHQIRGLSADVCLEKADQLLKELDA